MLKLVISDDEGKQTVVPLVRDEVTIGRKEGNTIRLTERNVSRRHARLHREEGAFVLEDLHSYNGIRVNGKRIQDKRVLEAGDEVQIGDYQLALKLDAAEARPPAEASVAEAETAMLAAPGGPPARLVMVTPPAPGAEFALTEPKLRVGRAEDLDIWVNHRSISREHAEIQLETDGAVRLFDLESANGVRVDGKDVQNARLSGGEVVELGQVRFRFVAQGQPFQFDADETVQFDALEPAGGGVRTPMLIGLAILVLASVVALAMVMGGGKGGPPVSAPAPEATVQEVSVEDPADAEAYLEALAGCEAALVATAPADALARAEVALQHRPEGPEAIACRERARALGLEEERYLIGVAAYDAGNLQVAYEAFAALPPASVYRDRSPVPEALARYAEAQAAFEAEAAARAAAVPASPRVPRARRPTAPETPEAPEPPPDVDASRQRMAQVRDCLGRGDNTCVIQLLAGRARTERELHALVEAYRANSQDQSARNAMRQYLQRYPEGRAADLYRRQVGD